MRVRPASLAVPPFGAAERLTVPDPLLSVGNRKTDHDTVIIGGGQAGLAMSYFRWRSERWDSLHFQFPNWSFQIPGHHYDGDAPDAFACKRS